MGLDIKTLRPKPPLIERPTFIPSESLRILGNKDVLPHSIRESGDPEIASDTTDSAGTPTISLL